MAFGRNAPIAATPELLAIVAGVLRDTALLVSDDARKRRSASASAPTHQQASLQSVVKNRSSAG
jgi:hypothetical protein